MQPGSPSLRTRSPTMRRPAKKNNNDKMPREEIVYRSIMGQDGKVRPQFEHLLLEAMCDSEDILDK